MGSWKAPGPNGLHVAFFQKAWGVVGDHISSSVIKLLEGEKLPEGMADALLVLIPKKSNQRVSDNFEY